jgi:DNA-binding CsgD family transcriptional regulator
LLFSEVSARSIESLLLRRLSPLQQKILSFLIEGYSLREIGIELRLSHPAVLRHRRKIAGCARQLGLETYLDRRTGKVLSVRHPSSKNRLHLSYPPSAVREGVVS